MALKYAQLREVECMRAVARAHQNRNLADFEKALKDYKDGWFELLLSLYPKINSDHFVMFRAIIRPYNPDASGGIIRYVTRAELVTHRRAVLSR